MNWWEAAPKIDEVPKVAQASAANDAGGKWWESAPLAAGGPAPASAPGQQYQFNILPLRKDEQGNDVFDSNAGLLGVLKRAFTAPHDIYKGQLSPFSVEGQDRALEMAATITPGSAASRALTGRFVQKQPAVPTSAELKAATDAGYANMRASGVEFSAETMRAFVDQTKQKLWSESHSNSTDKKTFALLDELASGPEGSTVRIDFLDKFRRKLGELAAGDESRAATAAIKGLDAWLDSVGPKDFMVRAPSAEGRAVSTLRNPAAGPTTDPAAASRAVQELTDARGNAATGFRSNVITGIEDTAKMRASAANSGQNLGNTIRQRLANLLTDEDAIRGFTSEEVAALRQIIDGTATTNTLRILGNLMGGGGGLGSVVSGGVAGAAAGTAGGNSLLGFLVGMGIPATGMAMRRAGNALTDRQLLAVDEAVRARSPLYRQRLANPGYRELPALTPEQQATLRLFLSGQTLPQP